MLCRYLGSTQVGMNIKYPIHLVSYPSIPILLPTWNLQIRYCKIHSITSIPLDILQVFSTPWPPPDNQTISSLSVPLPCWYIEKKPIPAQHWVGSTKQNNQQVTTQAGTEWNTNLLPHKIKSNSDYYHLDASVALEYQLPVMRKNKQQYWNSHQHLHKPLSHNSQKLLCWFFYHQTPRLYFEKIQKWKIITWKPGKCWLWGHQEGTW